MDKTNINIADISKLALIKEQNERTNLESWDLGYNPEQMSWPDIISALLGSTADVLQTYSYKRCENWLVSAGFREEPWLLCLRNTALCDCESPWASYHVPERRSTATVLQVTALSGRNADVNFGWIKLRRCSSAKLELGHSLKTESDAAGFGNTIFSQIFPLCYREPFALLPKLVPLNEDIIVYTSALSL